MTGTLVTADGLPETVHFDASGRLQVLDQLVLPRRIEYVACSTAREVADTIRDMKVRGAPAIGVAAAYGLVLALPAEAMGAAKLEASFEEACRMLAATRPTAVNLQWGIDRMLKVFKQCASKPLAELRAILLAEAHRIKDEDVEQCRAMGRHGAEVVPPKARILTHCNAGSLATAGYGTAVGVIRAAHEQGKVEQVWVDETRPYLQGARLTAFEMHSLRIPYKLVADNMAGHLMSRGLVDMVVVGADRITSRGHVANKIGTYSLAVLCHHHGIPFYVAAPLSTIDLALTEGSQIPIEERRPEELTMIGSTALAPEGAGTYNPAFDVTPPSLITGIVTPRGIARPPYAVTVPRLFEES